jgi:hypothetical protein
MLAANSAGNYHYLKGIEPYSSGVVADEGYEIMHATLRRPLPWREGFDLIQSMCEGVNRPLAALCGVELRSPAPFTRQGFIDFNGGYVERLAQLGLLLGEDNPIARTNVAPTVAAPSEPSLYAFSLTTPMTTPGPRTFVVAGAGELRGGTLLEAPVVRPGDTSPEGLQEKATYVMRVMSKRLEGLGMAWEGVTAIDLYTAYPFESWLREVVLETAGESAIHGVRWFPSAPPIDVLDFEMDVRGVRVEMSL